MGMGTFLDEFQLKTPLPNHYSVEVIDPQIDYYYLKVNSMLITSMCKEAGL